MSASSLLRILFGHGLAEAGGQPPPSTRETLLAAARADWMRAWELMEAHRIIPLVARAAEREPLRGRLPAEVATRLAAELRRTRLTSIVLMRTLEKVLACLRERGVEPVVWKGILLADSFYPEPGTRWMADVDFAIEPHEVEATTAAFVAAGFHSPEGLRTSDAVYFENRLGILYDVHHRVRLFEGRETDSVTMRLAPRHLQASHLLVLDPDAMVVHLTVHLDGHRGADGWLLVWLADLAFVLHEWGDRLDPSRVQALLPGPAHARSLLRVLALLRNEFGIEPPAAFRSAAASVEPYEFDALVRSRLFAQWGLSRPAGWGRLLGRALVPRGEGPGPIRPSLADLLRLPGDRWRERRLARQPVPALSSAAAV